MSLDIVQELEKKKKVEDNFQIHFRRACEMGDEEFKLMEVEQ